MKKQLIFWMLISLFMVSPSYAQEKIEFNETQKKILLVLLNPYNNTESIDDYVEKKQFDEEQAKKVKKDIKKIKDAIINQNLQHKEADEVIDKYLNGEISATDAAKLIKKITPNKNFQEGNENNDNEKNNENTQDGNEIAQNNKQENAAIVSTITPLDTSEENDKLREENNRLREELTEIYTQNIILKWENIPFSQYKKEKERDDRFNQEYQKIRKDHNNLNLPAEIKQKPDNYEQLPENIQKIYDLYGDYIAYQEGIRCINNPYDEQAIDAIIDIIGGIRDKTPENTPKRNELDSLHTQLFEYQPTVEIFQDLIKRVREIKKLLDKDIDWSEKLFDTRFVNPDDIDIKSIQSIPYLNRKLNEYIKVLNKDRKNKVDGKAVKDLEKEFLPEEQQQEEEQGEENNIENNIENNNRQRRNLQEYDIEPVSF